MTADAEFRLAELRVRHHAVVNARAAPVVARLDGVRFLVRDDILDDALLAGAIDGIEDLARLNVTFAIDLAVLLTDAVASDTGYALAGNCGALPERRVALLSELRSDLRMTAHAESADRTLRQLRKLLLEGVEHRRDRRVGVL